MNNFQQQTQAQQAYLINQAVQLIIQYPEKEFCSISWLQRMMRIGYNLASDIRLELLERKVVSGPDELNRYKIILGRK